MKKTVRGFALFMNWFDGICAPVCGLWMMASAVCSFPASWDSFMPIEILKPLPLPLFMKANFFWPGLALLLVNGLPNIIALILRQQGNRKGSYSWGMIAGGLLICWTVFEMLFIPNGLSVFYLILGIGQLAASAAARNSEGASESPSA